MKKDKDLRGKDIILNLKKICVHGQSYSSSSSCGNSTAFYFECSTKHGYMEDPNMTGEIIVLSAKKQKGCYLLKVRFNKEEDEEVEPKLTNKM
ncbi:MAG TPA: hypothetical protein PLH56_05335 [Candidatus Omnitrophota bacterium]|nr:hypothetical protein [Candidatus Omnitrophota bacterium]